MNRIRVFAMVVAVLVAGAAVIVVVLRGRTVEVEGEAIAPEPSEEDFAAALERRPKCWVKVTPSEPGKCSEVSRFHKGACYMANWSACSEYY